MNSIDLIYFSPTQSTAKIMKTIGDGSGARKQTVTDVTFHAVDDGVSHSQADLVVIGVPVYGGQVPKIVYSRLEKLQGNGVPAAVVVVYGNRAYDDALLELHNIMRDKGFTVIAAAAFVAEHSFSSASHPIASGRPDAADLRTAQEYGQKLAQLCAVRPLMTPVLSLTGNVPYRERPPSSRITPVTDAELCGECGRCVTVCPTQAIKEDNPLITNAEACIRCAACIKACRFNARAFTDQNMIGMAAKLHGSCQSRKEPEFFY